MRKWFVNNLIRFWYILSRRRKNRHTRKVGKIALFYRICDFGYNKVKPEFITKEKCLMNAVKAFPHEQVEWFVLADNVCEDTYRMILKYVPADKVERVNVGHGAGTFRMVYEKALELPDDTLVYFLEDDYLHLPYSLDNLISVASANPADYFTLYDHPDKYVNGYNPGVRDGGEVSKVFFVKNRHWKKTNSTTMTFASFVDTLKRDKAIFWRWTDTRHPYDFQIFVDLALFSKAYLVSPIPSLSTHGETLFLAPVIEWHSINLDHSGN